MRADLETKAGKEVIKQVMVLKNFINIKKSFDIKIVGR